MWWSLVFLSSFPFPFFFSFSFLPFFFFLISPFLTASLTTIELFIFYSSVIIQFTSTANVKRVRNRCVFSSFFFSSRRSTVFFLRFTIHSHNWDLSFYLPVFLSSPFTSPSCFTMMVGCFRKYSTSLFIPHQLWGTIEPFERENTSFVASPHAWISINNTFHQEIRRHRFDRWHMWSLNCKPNGSLFRLSSTQSINQSDTIRGTLEASTVTCEWTVARVNLDGRILLRFPMRYSQPYETAHSFNL